MHAQGKKGLLQAEGQRAVPVCHGCDASRRRCPRGAHGSCCSSGHEEKLPCGDWKAKGAPAWALVYAGKNRSLAIVFKKKSIKQTKQNEKKKKNQLKTSNH